jgi:hypothetical protein
VPTTPRARRLNKVMHAGTCWIRAKQGLQFADFVSGFIKKEEPWFRELWEALQAHFADQPITLIHGVSPWHISTDIRGLELRISISITYPDLMC